MTETAKKSVEVLEAVLEDEQEKLSAPLLKKLKAEKRWVKLFAQTTEEQWEKLFKEAREEVEKGEKTVLLDEFLNTQQMRLKNDRAVSKPLR